MTADDDWVRAPITRTPFTQDRARNDGALAAIGPDTGHSYITHPRPQLELLEPPVLPAGRPDWWDRAACLGVGPGRYFPEVGGNRSIDHIDAIRRCQTCPVKTECLYHAMTVPEIHGIWGGLTADQRKALRRQGPPLPPVDHGSPGGVANRSATCAAKHATNTGPNRRRPHEQPGQTEG